jgi:hypothetical protein
MIINYQNKVAINENPSIADINKVKAQDMNEIKYAFNTQVGPGWYNMPIDVTLTYSSYDSTNHIGVLSSNADLTPYLGVGAKLKFNNIGVAKYGIIIATTSSTVTIYLGTQSISEGAIESLSYSIVDMPFGFPQYMSSLDKLYLPFEIPIGIRNNKPYYRICLSDSSTVSGDHNISISGLSFDYIEIESFRIKSGQFILNSYGDQNSNDRARCFINSSSKNVIWSTGSSWANATFNCVLEYTKTTD